MFVFCVGHMAEQPGTYGFLAKNNLTGFLGENINISLSGPFF